MRATSFLLFFWVVNLSVDAQPIDTVGKRAGYNTIKVEDLRNYVTVLASREFFGREVGSEGANKAASYLTSFFRENGLRDSAKGRTGYQQPFRIIREGATEGKLEVGGQSFSSPMDIVVRHGELSSKMALKVVFAGFGDDHDFDSLDIKGKAVLILAKESLTSFGYSTYDKLKANHCPVVFVINLYHPERYAQVRKSSEDEQAGKRYLLENRSTSGDTASTKITEIYLSNRAAKAICGIEISDLLKLAEKSKAGEPSVLRKLSLGEVSVIAPKKKDRGIGYNIVGIIHGTDKASEVVAITAHYDHLGGRDSVYFPGADDNASGVSSIMEIAQAFNAAAIKGFRPRRTIAFIAFSGEESGLLGSTYFVQHNPLAGCHFVADVNLDMVGRQDSKMDNPNYLYATTDQTTKFLYTLADSLSRVDTGIALNLSKGKYMFFFGSDQYSFYSAGVPSILFFRGLHADYHQPTDTPDKLNYTSMVKITRLAFDTVWDLSCRNQIPKNVGAK
ncbi:MAG TPA: M20/M25/M40 family metallo-hydrolase [Williamwhitmania sp.]|nr:M20/M25/M40 family metallo-hydrolase [Williamwhitmania sp.]